MMFILFFIIGIWILSGIIGLELLAIIDYVNKPFNRYDIIFSCICGLVFFIFSIIIFLKTMYSISLKK